jgi:hypothetical protein
MRLAKLFLLTPALAQVGGKADRTHLLAALAEKDRGRDQDRNFRAVFAFEGALVACDCAAALAHFARNLLCLFFAGVERARTFADYLVGPVAE